MPPLPAGAGARQVWAAAEAWRLPVWVGESSVGAGAGCEGAERPGGEAHRGPRGGREGQESSPGGAHRAHPGTPGAAQHCECHRWMGGVCECLYLMSWRETLEPWLWHLSCWAAGRIRAIMTGCQPIGTLKLSVLCRALRCLICWSKSLYWPRSDGARP